MDDHVGLLFFFLSLSEAASVDFVLLHSIIILTDWFVLLRRLGPSKLACTGNLKEWTAIPQAHNITAPTLLINGQFDEIVDYATAPFFKDIPKVKWVTIPDASHMSMWEQRDKTMNIIADFIKSEV